MSKDHEELQFQTGQLGHEKEKYWTVQGQIILRLGSGKPLYVVLDFGQPLVNHQRNVKIASEDDLRLVDKATLSLNRRTGLAASKVQERKCADALCVRRDHIRQNLSASSSM